MAAEPAAPLNMKLLVDTKAGRVLYAEAGKDVVDFLFSLLALPLGTVTKLLTAGAAGAGSVPSPDASTTAVAAKLPTARAMVGSLGNIHRSLVTLDAGHVCRRGARDALLEPAVLHLTAAPAAPPNAGGRLFRCKGCSCSVACYNYATSVRGTPCPVCKGEMATEVQLVEPDGGAAAAAAGEGSSSSRGYVRDMVTYTVMDDLTVAPMSTICAVTAIAALGVTDITGLQAKTVEIGYKEGLALLKASLQSETVLTDVFLGGKQSSGARGQELPISDLGARMDSGAATAASKFWGSSTTAK